MRKKSIYRLISLLVFSSVFVSCDSTSSSSSIEKISNDPYVKSVEIISNPNKLKYFEGEIFAPEGLKFDATWVIRGKERVVSHTKSACTWTNKTDPLTADINKITFTIKQTDFTFDIPIEVTSLAAQSISINRGEIGENYLEGDRIDLYKITVQLETTTGAKQTLTPGSYTLFDNNQEIEMSNSYLLTAGEHEFKASFSNKTASFRLKAWAKSELKPTALTVKNVNFGNTLFAGQPINLNKIIVEEKFSDEKNLVNFTQTITDYEIKDGNTIIPSENRQNYVLSSGEHTFTVSKDGLTAQFTLKTSEFNKLIIEKKTSGNAVAKNTAFYANYAVYMGVENDPSNKVLINKGDYTLSAKRNGVSIADVNEENVFSEDGEVEVTIEYLSLKETFTVVVEGAIIINTANMVFTKDLPLNDDGSIRRDAEGNLVNSDGSLFETIVPGASSKYEVGKNFLEVPPNNGSYGDVGIYDNPGHVGNIKSGQKLVFHIWSDREAEADLVIYAASMNFADMNNWDGTYPTETSVEYYRPTVTEDVRFNSGITTTFGKDEVPFNVPDSVIVPGYTSQILEPNGKGCDTQGRYFDDRIWTAWSPVVLGKFNLVPGDNIVNLHININQLNLGMLEVRFSN